MINIYGINKLTDIIIKKSPSWKDMPAEMNKYLAISLYVAINGLSFPGVWWSKSLYTSVKTWYGLYTTLAFFCKEDDRGYNPVVFSFNVSYSSGKYTMVLYDNNIGAKYIQDTEDPVFKHLFKHYYMLNMRGL